MKYELPKASIREHGRGKGARYEAGLHATGVKLCVPCAFSSCTLQVKAVLMQLADWQSGVRSHNFLKQQSPAEYLPRFHCSKLMQASKLGEVSLTERGEKRKAVNAPSKTNKSG